MPPNYNPHSFDASFARIDAKLDALAESLSKHDANVSGLRTRVEVLERFKWVLVGAVAVLNVGARAAWEWARAKVA